MPTGGAAKKRWLKFFIWGGGAVGGLLPMIMNPVASALVAGKEGAQGAALGGIIGGVIGAIVDAIRKVRVPDLQPMSASPVPPSLPEPDSIRTFEEAKAVLERRNYKVIGPSFIGSIVRVVRPDGTQERMPEFHFARWARKELGAYPNSSSALSTPVLIRNVDEAKAVLERRNYKVIGPSFIGSIVRVVRPDGTQERMPEFHFARWARKELGVTDEPVIKSA